MKNINYKYGKSIIRTNLKYEFADTNISNVRIEDKFSIELKIYCGRKLAYIVQKSYENRTINYAISDIFKKEIEKDVTFREGYNYYATFKVFELKPVKRPKYQKTDTLIEGTRRKYILQERINISV